MKPLLLSLIFAALASCASVESDRARIPIMYATAKLIGQSSDVSAQDVLRHVERVRGLIGEDAVIDTRQIMQDVLASINTDRLDPADMLLLTLLMDEIQHYVLEIPVTERFVSVMKVLDWVEMGAGIYAD